MSKVSRASSLAKYWITIWFTAFSFTPDCSSLLWFKNKSRRTYIFCDVKLFKFNNIIISLMTAWVVFYCFKFLFRFVFFFYLFDFEYKLETRLSMINNNDNPNAFSIYLNYLVSKCISGFIFYELFFFLL